MALSNLIWWPWFGKETAAPPVVPEYNPMGDNPEARRSRRRRLAEIEEEDFILLLLSSEE